MKGCEMMIEEREPIPLQSKRTGACKEQSRFAMRFRMINFAWLYFLLICLHEDTTWSHRSLWGHMQIGFRNTRETSTLQDHISIHLLCADSFVFGVFCTTENMYMYNLIMCMTLYTGVHIIHHSTDALVKALSMPYKISLIASSLHALYCHVQYCKLYPRRPESKSPPPTTKFFVLTH